MSNKLSAKFIALTFAILLSGCASNSGSRFGSEPDSSGSNAPGWAYAAEGFTVNKNQPVHEQSAYEFYYKRCQLGGDRPYYSKTSYECTEAR